MKTIFFTTFQIIINAFCFSQNNNARLLNITGRVLSCDSQPISGVSVIIKGIHYGATMTYGNGNYNLKGIKDGDTVVFSHIAYKRTIVKIKGNTLLNIVMEKAIITLPSLLIVDSVSKKNNIVPVKSNGEKYIFDLIEIEPSFPGGNKALFKYLNTVVKYPEEARNKNIEGEVIIGFTVGLEGEIKNVKIVHGISKECDEAAVKAVSGMPKWNYGIQNGRFTEAYMELPITFSLKETN